MKYLTLALAVSGAAALSLRSPSLQRIRIHSRQAAVLDPGEVPSQCQTQCAPVLSDTQVLQPLTLVLQRLSGQQRLNRSKVVYSTVFNTGCAQAGISVPAVTVPGIPAATGASSAVAVPTVAPPGVSSAGTTGSPVPQTTLPIPSGGITIATGNGGITINTPSTGTGVASLPAPTGFEIGGENATSIASIPLNPTPVAVPSGSTAPSIGKGNSAQRTIIGTGLPIFVGLIGSVFLL
ncbi:hypothetical protein BU17DRAFT_59979 [Hysterangium stoloniferum]|nr:hypothetical protein BU17DRAFT_59979 [Hysterangium stoloniferum]